MPVPRRQAQLAQHRSRRQQVAAQVLCRLQERGDRRRGRPEDGGPVRRVDEATTGASTGSEARIQGAIETGGRGRQPLQQPRNCATVLRPRTGTVREREAAAGRVPARLRPLRDHARGPHGSAHPVPRRGRRAARRPVPDRAGGRPVPVEVGIEAAALRAEPIGRGARGRPRRPRRGRVRRAHVVAPWHSGARHPGRSELARGPRRGPSRGHRQDLSS